MTEQVLETAADWFLRIRSPKASVEDQAAWLKWVEAEPAHRQAFAEIQRAWDVAGGTDQALLSQPVGKKKAKAEFVAMHGRSRWALAAMVLSASGLGALLFLHSHSLDHEHVTTARGEQQSAVLPDGSHVELGALTGVKVAYTATQRLVVADEGEAFYRVARDQSRPFVVRSGPVSVTALGTAFSVRREGDAVSVAVSDGVVEVKAEGDSTSPVRAAAGERVQLNHGRLERHAQAARTEAVTTWRRGRLRFEEEPLGVVAASLNRYSRREITIADPALAELRFTGTVFDDRVEDWLHGVQVVFPVRVREIDDRHVVIERAFQK